MWYGEERFWTMPMVAELREHFRGFETKSFVCSMQIEDRMWHGTSTVLITSEWLTSEEHWRMRDFVMIDSWQGPSRDYVLWFLSTFFVLDDSTLVCPSCRQITVSVWRLKQIGRERNKRKVIRQESMLFWSIAIVLKPITFPTKNWLVLFDVRLKEIYYF